MKKKTQIGCAVLAALVFILAVWFFTIWMAPIDITIPPREYPQGNVYPIYKELAKNHEDWKRIDARYSLGMKLIANQTGSRTAAASLTPSEQEAIRYALNKFEAIRQKYIALGNKPCAAVYEYDSQFLFPEFSVFREWARTEQYLMRLNLKAGNRYTALQSYDGMLRLSEQTSREGLLIHSLVGRAIRAIVYVQISEHLQDFSAPECDQIVRVTREWLHYRFPMANAMEYEKFFYISIYRDIQSGKINFQDAFGTGDEPWAVYRFARFLNLRAAARECSIYLDSAKAEYSKPLLKQKALPEPRHILNRILFPVFDSATAKEIQTEAVLRMTGCAAAVRAYKLRHGRYPKTLAEAGVKDLNYDPYTGGEFTYKVKPTRGFLIYSVGKDGKDDGGKRAVRNFDKPGTDVSPILYRDPGGQSPEAAPPGPPAWMK